jgi:hypothetical protein
MSVQLFVSGFFHPDVTVLFVGGCAQGGSLTQGCHPAAAVERRPEGKNTIPAMYMTWKATA